MGNTGFKPRSHSVPHGREIANDKSIHKENNSSNFERNHRDINSPRLVKAQYLGGNSFRCPWCYIISRYYPDRNGRLKGYRVCTGCGETYCL